MWLFFAFLGVGLVLTIFGFVSDIPIFSMIGTIMIFLLGLSLLNVGLTYKVGEEEVYVYGNYFDGYHWDGSNATAPSQVDKEAFLFHVDVVDVYDVYDDSAGDRYGWFLLILGALGFVFALFTLGGNEYE
jgi:hypothetical protein